MKQAIDNFSAGTAEYALYRPESPKELFDFLYAHTPAFHNAWDCGTGNGQVATVLAERFDKVYATDISINQLRHAPQKENITYLQERAEHTTLPTHSIDLITVAQAIHWFDFESFYKEVHRIAKPGALIAAWTYSKATISPEVDKVVDHLFSDITGPYWDKERKLVDEEYRTIPFPFKELVVPELFIIKDYTLQQLAGYLRTWSGVRHYIEQMQQDPVALILPELKTVWGNTETLEIKWPLHIRAGVVAP